MNFEDELKHVPEIDDQPPIPDDVPASRIIPQDLLSDDLNADYVETAPLVEKAVERDPSTVTRRVPDDSPVSGESHIISPEEAKELGLAGDGAWQKVDGTGNAIAEVDNKLKAAQDSQLNETLGLIDDLVGAEKARNIALDEKLADADTRKILIPDGESGTGRGVVNYSPDLPTSEDGYIQRTQIASDSAPDQDELIPSYSYEDDDEPPEATEKPPEEKRPAAGDNEEYIKYVKNLVVTDLEYGDEVITISREKGCKVSTVPSGRKKSRVMGDQAFDNSINKFKRDNFRVVDAPLINSGIMASIVGTGGVDLILLYDQTDKNTTGVDYELEKMRIVMQSVVGTDPKVDKNELRNITHYVDYQIMAYAHVVATLEKVELVQTCTECGHDFRIRANPADLLLNAKEIKERMRQIKAASKSEYLSLMARDRRIDTDDGFSIVLGHPSYAEYVQYLSDLRAMNDQLSKGQLVRIVQLAEILPFVRDIRMPDGTAASSLYQRFRALTMLTDLTVVTEQILAMSKQIMYPKFGIRRVVCPHCGRVNRDIAYSGLNEVLFFHITVSRLLNATEQ